MHITIMFIIFKCALVTFNQKSFLSFLLRLLFSSLLLIYNILYMYIMYCSFLTELIVKLYIL